MIRNTLVVGLGHGMSPFATVIPATPVMAVLGPGLVYAGDPYVFEALGAACVDATGHFDAVPGRVL
jgi:hypothetical protein